MKTFLVFGNPLVEQDSIALRIIPKLKERFPCYEFRDTDPTENLEHFGKDLWIIDVIHNSDKILLIDNLNKIEETRVSSMHDFDLTLNLKLLLKTKKISSFKIIGISWNMKEDEAVEGVSEMIKKMPSRI